MQLDMKSLETGYNVIKFWGPILGYAWMFFKALQWVRDLRTKDLPDIKSNVVQVHSELQTQTSSIVNELKELRSDMRTYFVQQPRALARAKKAGKR